MDEYGHSVVLRQRYCPCLNATVEQSTVLVSKRPHSRSWVKPLGQARPIAPRWEVDRDVAETAPLVHELLPVEERMELLVEALSRIALDRDSQEAVPGLPHHAIDRQRLVPRRDLVSECDAVREERQAAHHKATVVHLLDPELFARSTHAVRLQICVDEKVSVRRLLVRRDLVGHVPRRYAIETSAFAWTRSRRRPLDDCRDSSIALARILQ